jgi:hypothetical protein
MRNIVVIVGYKVLNRVLREELFKLGIELPRQGLIMSDHQCGDIELCDDIRHGKGLAGARNTKQSLALVALLEAPDQLLDGLGLVAGGGVFAM